MVDMINSRRGGVSHLILIKQRQTGGKQQIISLLQGLVVLEGNNLIETHLI